MVSISEEQPDAAAANTNNGGTAVTAAALKDEANTHFNQGQYQRALEMYSDAISLLDTEGKGQDPESAKYYANRAFANLRLENYGSAVEDGTTAVTLDPKFPKGYYRRGSAYLALGKFKEGRENFKMVTRVAPGSADARKKLKECETAIRRIQFEAAIAVADEERGSVADNLDVSTIEVDTSYTGARIEGGTITQEAVDTIVADFKNQKLIHRKYALMIMLNVKDILAESPTIEEIDVPEGKHFTVCGDVHGQFYDLCNIFEKNGKPSLDNPYLFNGDFVDRGSFSVEVIFTLFAYKWLYPRGMFLTRGNHETRNMNRIYGFDGEARAKYNGMIADFFAEIFCLLPLGAVLNDKVFVIHGGLFSRDDVTLDELKKIDRNREPPDAGEMCEILWSDPMPEPGRSPSRRGVGCNFGPDITENFLKRNNLELLVRSHEMKEEGYEVAHDGKCITIFSAPNYCDQLGNLGAYIRFEYDMKPKFTTFSAVPHPSVRPMEYASGMGGLM